MVICDLCRNLKTPVLDLRLVIQKPDPTSGRIKPEELKSVRLELCDRCMQVVWECLVESLKSRIAEAEPKTE